MKLIKWEVAVLGYLFFFGGGGGHIFVCYRSNNTASLALRQ